MADYSKLYAETKSRLEHVLTALSRILTEAEREEVLDFLKSREYGLALGTLSHILVEENKAIDGNVLHQIDDIASAMHLRDEPFMYDLHTSYDRQGQPQGAR